VSAVGELPGATAVQARLEEIRCRLRAAGGDPAAIEIVAVTKGFPPPIVDVARRAGLDLLGENYAQELVAKAAWLAQQAPGPGVHWQFIGRLQRNKVRSLAAHVECWQSIDRPALLDELARRVPGARLLLQVDTTGEPGKGGCPPGQVDALLERAASSGLVVEGLMTVGPTDPDVSPRTAFASLRRLVDRHNLRRCSMGMTDDLEIAVEEGTTMIRVGRALFGPRPRGDDVGN
jgi:pyridoxal phosphate enzyme (YggS family)